VNRVTLPAQGLFGKDHATQVGDGTICIAHPGTDRTQSIPSSSARRARACSAA
jgi:hypothetical protein